MKEMEPPCQTVRGGFLFACSAVRLLCGGSFPMKTLYVGGLRPWIRFAEAEPPAFRNGAAANLEPGGEIRIGALQGWRLVV